MSYSMSDLLQLVVSEGASDLHVRVGTPPTIRVHGILHRVEGPSLSPEDSEELMRSITSEEHIQHVRERGGADFGFAFGDMARFRVSVFKEKGNFGVVLRQIPTKMLTMEQIGLPPSTKELLYKPRGLVLVTGPTGSGKTTTLYSTLKRLATEEVNVSTIEDPIEMIEPAFNQTQVQPHLDFDFPEGLRALMRQDPDIIMVGEIRDLATAEMAVQAALTGHLVFSTLHTNDAPSAVSRLMELGVPSYLINATLLGVLAQRLVRTLCSQCRERDDSASRDTLAELVKPWQISGGYRPYKPAGCVDCRMTGFRGRMGLYELLTVTEGFKEKVSKEPNIDALRRQAIMEGMRPLRLAGALKVAEGLTTVEEILSATPPMP